MKVQFTFLDTEYACIHLGDAEWGNDTMWTVAEAFFAENPSCQFVQVIEHAGWLLGFRRDGSIWTTANDIATVTGSRPESLAYVVRRTPNDQGMLVEYSTVDRARLRIVA